jgi:hypothetical protein
MQGQQRMLKPAACKAVHALEVVVQLTVPHKSRRDWRQAIYECSTERRHVLTAALEAAACKAVHALEVVVQHTVAERSKSGGAYY